MTLATPYQPSLLRLLHGVAAAVAGVASFTGFLIYNHYDGRFGRLPLGGSEQVIDLHGDLVFCPRDTRAKTLNLFQD